MEFNVSPEVREVLRREWIDAIHDAGLVFIPKQDLEDAIDFNKLQQALLKEKYVSVYKVAKFKLLPHRPSYDTIMLMLKDGRIARNEIYIDKKGTTNLMGFAIKRLRGE